MIEPQAPAAGRELSEAARRLFYDVLEHEARSIEKVARELAGEAVVRAVSLLRRCTGQVVFLGVGKSGLVARKIAATMASTGTLASYLHASDALHGDLGTVTGQDLAVMVSHSGETDELVALLPHLARRRIPLLAIVGNPHSAVARRADVILSASIDREACPLNLAPTSSTTVALAIGDALAMAVACEKGLTREDFALNHPAGRLGKRLTLRTLDLMHSGAANPCIGLAATFRDVVIALSQFRLGGVNVVDEEGRLAGLVTEGDLRRVMNSRSLDELGQLLARDLMTRTPVTVGPEVLAYEALTLMDRGALGISVLPVTDETGRAVGMLRLQDLVRSGI